MLIWTHGGGFEQVSTANFDGSSFVASSVAPHMSVVIVAMNYRLGGFGFLPGAEIFGDDASNTGLLDQFLALKWVADNIATFEGDL